VQFTIFKAERLQHAFCMPSEGLLQVEGRMVDGHLVSKNALKIEI
jgi:hypothetical protein